jgi:hypothetical protein
MQGFYVSTALLTFFNLLNGPNMHHSIDDIDPALQSVFQFELPGAVVGHAQKRISSYSKLLEGPISNIAGNVPERSDTASIAILGYN